MHLVSSHIVKIIAEAIAALKSVSRDSLFENAPILISEIDKKTAGCVGIHLLSGIPDEMNDRLFQPFQTTKPVGLGTGLGLSICILLVRKYNGSIECESSPGSGALFRVILPVSKTRDVSPIAPTEKTPPVKKNKWNRETCAHRG